MFKETTNQEAEVRDVYNALDAKEEKKEPAKRGRKPNGNGKAKLVTNGNESHLKHLVLNYQTKTFEIVTDAELSTKAAAHFGDEMYEIGQFHAFIAELNLKLAGA